MGMKKKMLSATLCAVMVGSLVAPAFTVQAADDTLVYWSMWDLSHPTSVDSPASNDGQRNHTAYVRQNLPPLYDALRESRPIQNLYSPLSMH